MPNGFCGIFYVSRIASVRLSCLFVNEHGETYTFSLLHFYNQAIATSSPSTMAYRNPQEGRVYLMTGNAAFKNEDFTNPLVGLLLLDCVNHEMQVTSAVELSSNSTQPPIDSLPSMHLIMHATVKVISDLMQPESSEYSHWCHFIREMQQYVDRETHVFFSFFSAADFVDIFPAFHFFLRSEKFHDGKGLDTTGKVFGD
jgi:hypothetical protein